MEITHATEITLGNGWEVGVDLNLDFEGSSPGRVYGPPEDCYPPEGVLCEIYRITANEAVEELGIKRGQEIHPAFVEGGLDRLERELGETLDNDDPYEPDDYY